MNKLIAALAAVSMLGFAANAFAGEPVQLTNQQMDSVTAGSISGFVVNLSAFATGGYVAATETKGAAGIVQIPVKVGPVFLSGGAAWGYGSSISTN